MTPRELAAAIRKGAAMTGEAKYFMTNTGGHFSVRSPGKENCCCALGAAWLGSGRTEKEWHQEKSLGVEKAARVLSIPFELAAKIDEMHTYGDKNRLAIADWLDTLEPETKPADKQTFDAFMATVQSGSALREWPRKVTV